MNKQYLRQHCRLATGDLDQAREHVSRLWERHEAHLVSGRKYGIRWHQAEMDQTTLAYVETSSRLKVVCGPVGERYRFTMHETGAVHHVINGQAVSATPEQAVLHVPGEDLRLETAPFQNFILTFNRTIVDAALGRRFDVVPRLGETGMSVPMKMPHVRTLQSLCRWTAGELDQPESGLCTSPQAAASLQRTLLSLFLDGIAVLCPDSSRRDHMAAARLAQIEAWMEAHFADPIGVEEMAAVAGVSVRSVQAAFRRIRGCSPMAALICLRLDRARDRLRAAHPDERVTDIATECGFFHFGRFAQQYRQRFGELPSTTLLQAIGQKPLYGPALS